MKTHRLNAYALVCLLILSFWAPLGFAQTKDETGQAPRDIIIEDLLSGTDIVKPDSDIAPDVPAPKIVKEKIKERATHSEDKHTIILPNNDENDQNEKDQDKVQVYQPTKAIFSLSSKEYLALRGNKIAPQLTLTYHVSTQKKGMLLPITSNVELILGHDYAAIRTKNKQNLVTKIYDFAVDRRLLVHPKKNKNDEQSPQIHFENISLYAPIYRNVSTVKAITRGGKLKTIPMEKGKTLDAFWVESAMSWTAQSHAPTLNIQAKKTTLNIFKKNQLIFKAKFKKQAYTQDGFQHSLLALAHHEWPLHPNVLGVFSKYNAPPSYLKMLSFGPRALGGETQIWTLIDAKTTKAKFPLPEHALNVIEHDPIDPFAFIINEAVRGRALGGYPDIEALKETFTSVLSETTPKDAPLDHTLDRNMELWIIGQKYHAYTGKCTPNSDDSICKTIQEIETSEAEKSESLQDFIKAMTLAKDGKSSSKIIKLILPYLYDAQTPAFMTRIAALAGAKMTKLAIKTLENELGIENFNATELLQSALAKDPYDPHTYLALAQIYAANGAFETSWDIYDALRAGIPTAGILDLKISKVEDKLRSQAAGYFSPRSKTQNIKDNLH